jgi:alpha-mannosidase
MAEKMATLASIRAAAPWPESALNEAWRTLLLSQHHDCWIVPYNGKRDDTWADKVSHWIDGTRKTSAEIINKSTETLSSRGSGEQRYGIRVFNTLAKSRTHLVNVTLPSDWTGDVSIQDQEGTALASQILKQDGQREILFNASAPPMGYRTFWLKQNSTAPAQGATAVVLPDGSVQVETDHFHAELDPNKGGTIRSLVAKQLGNRQLVDEASSRRMNELRGYFFEKQRFESSAESPAKIEIVEAGPVRVRLRVSGQIASQAVTQWITMSQGEPRIDLSVTIDWQGSPGIGADINQSKGFHLEDDRKAFYDDRFKLQALFPLNLHHRKIFKDAPFDVTESKLTNTFFDTWSGIKNNIILNWVDAFDGAAGVGVALFIDHTTSYAHGQDDPLGLILQYRGVGLWGRNYAIQGLTTVKYALLPHAGNWRSAGLWNASAAWNEPLVARLYTAKSEAVERGQSLLTIDDADWEIPTTRMLDGNILVRFFNPTTDNRAKTVHFGSRVSKIEQVHLNGQVIKELPVRPDGDGRSSFELSLPPMGIGTVRISPEPASTSPAK